MKKTKQQKSLLEYYHFSKKEQKEYPIISRILKQLTPEKIKKEIEEVQKTKLPPELQKWVKEYEKVGKRTRFTWKQVFNAAELISLPIISKKYSKNLHNTKFLASMLIILIDDIADRMQNRKLLDEILKIPIKENFRTKNLSKEKKRFLNFVEEIWQELEKSVKKLPEHKYFQEIFEFNIRQFLNGMEYSYLVNKKPYLLINKTESNLYLFSSICSMQILFYATTDFMCSSMIFFQKFKYIRKIIQQAQEMTRNGNWVGTWEKEIKDNDFTSGVFSYTIDSQTISVDDLKAENVSKIVQKIKNSNVEKNLLKEWEKNYNEISKTSKKIQNINITKYLFGLEKLLILSLSNKHLKE